ncbi:MAG: polysaccharide export protein [Pseudomonadales bacterium]|nr:polysaccharide export protein [Pseudomonadales bacterium]
MAYSENVKKEIYNKETEYKMGSGDKLEIKVFGEEDLTGEFAINSEGKISFPLIGDIHASGLSLLELTSLLVRELKDGYLVSPKVTIQILQLRPFYIMGEVKLPGSYEYISGMKVINAVVLAGGYTHRANTKNIFVKRVKGIEYEEIEVNENFGVLPGDTIKIKERFF